MRPLPTSLVAGGRWPAPGSSCAQVRGGGGGELRKAPCGSQVPPSRTPHTPCALPLQRRRAAAGCSRAMQPGSCPAEARCAPRWRCRHGEAGEAHTRSASDAAPPWVGEPRPLPPPLGPVARAHVPSHATTQEVHVVCCDGRLEARLVAGAHGVRLCVEQAEGEGAEDRWGHTTRSRAAALRAVACPTPQQRAHMRAPSRRRTCTPGGELQGQGLSWCQALTGWRVAGLAGRTCM